MYAIPSFHPPFLPFFTALIPCFFFCFFLSSDSGSNLKKPGPADKLTAALRYTTARQWRLRATRWYAPPLAAVLGVAGMCVFVLGGCLFLRSSLLRPSFAAPSHCDIFNLLATFADVTCSPPPRRAPVLLAERGDGAQPADRDSRGVDLDCNYAVYDVRLSLVSPSCRPTLSLSAHPFAAMCMTAFLFWVCVDNDMLTPLPAAHSPQKSTSWPSSRAPRTRSCRCSTGGRPCSCVCRPLHPSPFCVRADDVFSRFSFALADRRHHFLGAHLPVHHKRHHDGRDGLAVQAVAVVLDGRRGACAAGALFFFTRLFLLFSFSFLAHGHPSLDLPHRPVLGCVPQPVL